jgi:hypothetical protein
MYDGQQSVPFNVALDKLYNNYDAQWKGAWLGIDALIGLGDALSLNATAEYHRIEYTAVANWNLRTDLSHPLSFTHVANGHGVLLSTGVSYRLSRNLMLHAILEQQHWVTDEGVDQTYFSYGTTSNYTLNPVSWDSRSVSLGAIYQF